MGSAPAKAAPAAPVMPTAAHASAAASLPVKTVLIIRGLTRGRRNGALCARRNAASAAFSTVSSAAEAAAAAACNSSETDCHSGGTAGLIRPVAEQLVELWVTGGLAVAAPEWQLWHLTSWNATSVHRVTDPPRAGSGVAKAAQRPSACRRASELGIDRNEQCPSRLTALRSALYFLP